MVVWGIFSRRKMHVGLQTDFLRWRNLHQRLVAKIVLTEIMGIKMIHGILLLQISRHLSHRHSLLFLIAEQSHVVNH